jgi:hypothetical protein
MTIVNVFGGAELRQAARAATGSIYRGTMGEGVMIAIRAQCVETSLRDPFWAQVSTYGDS